MSQAAEIDKIVAVSNTGPLISAFQCGRIDLLKRYFSVIYITASELAELEKHGWTDDIRQLIDEGFVSVVEELTEREKELAEGVARRIATDPASHDPEWRNHLPEAEVMVLMQQRTHLAVGQILLDEKAARTVAQELGLPMTGFPGVLGRAGLDGLLTQDEIRQLLQTCRQQGTHYSGELIEAVARTYGR
jgi:predicted nucleic acid-binding protein